MAAEGPTVREGQTFTMKESVSYLVLQFLEFSYIPLGDKVAVSIFILCGHGFLQNLLTWRSDLVQLPGSIQMQNWHVL